MEKQLQISIPREEIPCKNCVFTGHRELGEEFSPRALKKQVENLLLRGVNTFYNGMAMGFDLIAAETVLSLKKKHPSIKLIACIPCLHQEKNFTPKDKKRYLAILKKADEQIILSQHYYNGCMHVRDKYMADRGDVMIAYCKKQTGGTAFTVRYFQKRRPDGEIIFL